MAREIHPAVAGAQPFMLADREQDRGALFASEEGRARLEAVLGRYPEKRGALLPLLNYAQERRGWVSAESMVEIAEALDLTPAYVHSVASFYTMYNKHPVGRYLVQVCTNIACHLNRADEVLERFLAETDTRPGETSADGLFTVMEVECLGACGFATVVQVNDEYLEDVSPEVVPELVRELAARRAEPDGGAGERTETGARARAPEGG